MSTTKITVEKLDTGYVVRGDGWMAHATACVTLEECLQRVAFELDALSEHFGGTMYAKVTVSRERPAAGKDGRDSST